MFESTFIVFNFYPFYRLKCQTSIDYISPCALYLSVRLVNFCGEKCKTVPCGQLYRLADWEMDVPKGKVKARLLLSAGWCTKVGFVRYHKLWFTIHSQITVSKYGIWIICKCKILVIKFQLQLVDDFCQNVWSMFFWSQRFVTSIRNIETLLVFKCMGNQAVFGNNKILQFCCSNRLLRVVFQVHNYSFFTS